MNYDKDNTHQNHPTRANEHSLDLFTATISFLGINLMWIFFAVGCCLAWCRYCCWHCSSTI